MLSICFIWLLSVFCWTSADIQTGFQPQNKPDPPGIYSTRHAEGHTIQLGRVPLSPGPMALVTKDVRIRYMSGMGPMALVTNYIEMQLSLFISCMLWPGTSATQPRTGMIWLGRGTHPPNRRVRKGKWGDGPTRKFTKISEFLNSAVSIDFNNRVNSEYIRGESHLTRAA